MSVVKDAVALNFQRRIVCVGCVSVHRKFSTARATDIDMDKLLIFRDNFWTSECRRVITIKEPPARPARDQRLRTDWGWKWGACRRMGSCVHRTQRPRVIGIYSATHHTAQRLRTRTLRVRLLQPLAAQHGSESIRHLSKCNPLRRRPIIRLDSPLYGLDRHTSICFLQTFSHDLRS